MCVCVCVCVYVREIRCYRAITKCVWHGHGDCRLDLYAPGKRAAVRVRTSSQSAVASFFCYFCFLVAVTMAAVMMAVVVFVVVFSLQQAAE